MRFSQSHRSIVLSPWQKQALVLVIVAIVILGLMVFFFRPVGVTLPRVAIGGGEYQGMRNTNSFQAMDTAWQKGFRSYKIDLRWTRDQKLVCIGDWRTEGPRLFTNYRPMQPPFAMTLPEFTSRPTVGGVRPCTLDTLSDWLKAHPEAQVIVDMRGQRKLAAFQLIKSKVPNFQEQIIPQVLTTREYQAMQAMGYKRIVLLHSTPPPPKQYQAYADWLRKVNPYALVIPVQRAQKDQALLQLIRNAKIPLYVWGVNDCAQLKELRKQGATEAYTQILSPQDCSL